MAVAGERLNLLIITTDEERFPPPYENGGGVVGAEGGQWNKNPLEPGECRSGWGAIPWRSLSFTVPFTWLDFAARHPPSRW